ncbi:MAG: hypothetical protein NXI04_07980 [Planctomycetaceae bacterium]|nr:hypothetical protein [Planctomycetaceae bacterium]
MPCLLLVTDVALADDLIFQIGGAPVTESGAEIPDDAVSIRFQQRAEGNAVELTVDTAGMPTNTDKLKSLFFNFFQAGVSIDDLSFTAMSGPSVKKFEQKEDRVGPRHGVGRFDLGVEYRTSAHDKFSADEVSRILIDHDSEKLLVSSFDLGVQGDSTLRAKVHILDTGDASQSGFYRNQMTAVPEPGQFGVMAALLAVACCIVRRRSSLEARAAASRE